MECDSVNEQGYNNCWQLLSTALVENVLFMVTWIVQYIIRFLYNLGPLAENDLAIVKVKDSFQPTREVLPICLLQNNLSYPQGNDPTYFR